MKTHVPGWISRPGAKTAFRGNFPLQIKLTVSEEMMSFLTIQAEEMSRQTGRKVSRQELIRECIETIAWERFDTDLDG